MLEKPHTIPIVTVSKKRKEKTMSAQQRKKNKKKNNSSTAYLGFLSVLAVGIVILLVLMAAVGSCKGSASPPTESESETTPTVNSGSSAKESESSSVSSTNMGVSGNVAGINIPTNIAKPEETTPSDAVIKIPYNAEEDWALYVIGNDNPLPADFTVETKAVAGERTLDSRCADYAIEMLNEAAEQNVGLFVTSSYRSVEKQAQNMESYINNLISQGYSQEEAKIQAEKEIALPGHSEHNAGLAMDIVSNDYWSTHSDLDESFEKLPQFDWLIDNSWKYGFILSYPKGKENITGFIYEPWHYRFVGLKHAENIHKVYKATGEFLTINEYIERYIDME